MESGELLAINRVKVYNSFGKEVPGYFSAFNCFFEVIINGGGIVSIHASNAKWVVNNEAKKMTATIFGGRNLTIIGTQKQMYEHMLQLGMIAPNGPNDTRDRQPATKNNKQKTPEQKKKSPLNAIKKQEARKSKTGSKIANMKKKQKLTTEPSQKVSKSHKAKETREKHFYMTESSS